MTGWLAFLILYTVCGVEHGARVRARSGFTPYSIALGMLFWPLRLFFW